MAERTVDNAQTLFALRRQHLYGEYVLGQMPPQEWCQRSVIGAAFTQGKEIGFTEMHVTHQLCVLSQERGSGLAADGQCAGIELHGNARMAHLPHHSRGFFCRRHEIGAVPFRIGLQADAHTCRAGEGTETTQKVSSNLLALAVVEAAAVTVARRTEYQPLCAQACADTADVLKMAQHGFLNIGRAE